MNSIIFVAIVVGILAVIGLVAFLSNIPEPVVIPPVEPPIVNDTKPPVNDTKPPVVTPPVEPPKPIKVIVVGDIADTSSGNKVYDAIKNQNADYVFVLGDNGYGKVSWFKSTYGTLDQMYCILGNHEAENEDGSAEIEKIMLDFCGNSYWIKNGATLFVMLNTNDPNLSTLATKTDQIVFQNSTIMKDVKTVHIMSHKPCAVPPNSHHPVEIKSLCDSIKSKLSGFETFYTSGHNHIYSESKDKQYKQVGTGGKSHYTCGTSAEFPYCNDSDYGYLQYIIQANGTTTSSFYDFNGVVKR